MEEESSPTAGCSSGPDHNEQPTPPAAAASSIPVVDLTESRSSKNSLMMQEVKNTVKYKYKYIAQGTRKKKEDKAQAEKTRRPKATLPIDQLQINKQNNEKIYSKIMKKHITTPALIKTYTDTFKTSCLIRANDNTEQSSIVKLANEI